MFMQKYIMSLLVLMALVFSCNETNGEGAGLNNQSKGKLFIIGGGKRPAFMIDSLIKAAGIDKEGYIVILPFASEEEDTAILYSTLQFTERGVDSVFFIHTDSTNNFADSVLKIVENASLIYITGGDQNKFMKSISGTSVGDIITKAYNKGAVISGTSAGAAVMSQKMISGNELKHPEYTGIYSTIEANNIELTEGLGLIEHVIVDQHFIKRLRVNRLIAVCLENPENTCIGIDESTAILIVGDQVKVIGVSQVLVLKHKQAETKIVNGLLGGKNLELSIYVPGDTFNL